MREKTMAKRARVLAAAVGCVVLPVAAYATPTIYTDTHGDQVGSTNKARDIWSASIDDDGSTIYITINDDPGADLVGSTFNYGIGLTTGSPTAGGDTSANPATHGNWYNRTISIDSSLGGMLDFIGLFPTGTGNTGFGYNDATWNGTTWIAKSNVQTGVIFANQTGGTTKSSITVAVPLADFASNLPSTLGSVIKFDIYSTGTAAGQTAYDSLADNTFTNTTGTAPYSGTTQYNGTVLDSYTIQGTGPLSLVWDNSAAVSSVADGATWDQAQNGIAGGLLNQNWKKDGANPFYFFSNNAVTFNDSNNGHYAVTLVGTLRPASITVNNSSGNYVFSGTGGITGTAGIAKSGSGSLTIGTTNTLTGGLMINGGSVVIGNANSLGFGGRLVAGQTPGSTTVNATTTFDLNGVAINEPINLNGGTLANSSSSPATVSSGIKGVGLASANTPFSADANVTLTGGGGTGAVSKAVLSLTQASLSLTAKGSGYSTVPTVTISGGGGSSATATATLGVAAASFTITPGSGYTSAPTVTITGNGTGATATANISSGQVTGITITNPGTGYSNGTTPTIAFAGGGGTGASGTGNTTHFIVNGVTLNNAGLNFTSVPTVALSGGGGTGASVTALDNNFNLLGIQQISAGTGYTSTPTANFTATTGTVTLGSVMSSAVNLQATSSIGGTGNINIAAPISGPGGLNKIGTNTLTLSGPGTYLGNTTISSGTLAVTGSGSISNSPHINLNGGSLDVSGVTSPPFIVGSSQTLMGQGTVTGAVNVLGTIQTGQTNNTLGKTASVLTLGTGSTLGGSTLMDLTAINASDEITVGSGMLNFGGTLNVTNPNTIAFAAGQSYDLFGFGTHSGLFSNLPIGMAVSPASLPTLGGGLVWNTSTVYSNGIISIGGPSSLTWNNTGGTGDGTTWANGTTPTTLQNWQNAGSPSYYSDSPGDNVTFNDTNNSNYAVTINTVVTPGSTIVNTTGAYVFSGTGGIGGGGSLTKSGTGSLTLSTSDSYTGGTNVTGGTLNIEAVSALPTASALSISSGATVVVDRNGNGRITLDLATLSNSGTINLKDNRLVIHNTTQLNADATTAAVFTQLQNGFAGGTWTGGTSPQILSSAAAGSSLYTLGEVESGTDVLVRYAYYGDANLDGGVDGTDYSLIDTGFGSAGAMTGWQNGDFNYDGFVDGSDYSLIDNAFNTQTGLAPAAQVASNTSEIAGGSAAVPEPASLGLLAVGALGLTNRRRRRD
jgi:fibronectin-binding autotransporter adhesin